MAHYQNHFSFAIVASAAYASAGLFAFNVPLEQVLLASVIVVITGLIPDIDANEGEPARELGILMSVVSPLIILEMFPGLKNGGVSRVTLVVICCYVLTRVLIVRGLKVWTVHRGIIHSIPAAIIAFEIVYLLFWDLYTYDRLYLGGAALAGYFSHLFVDAYSNLDFVGKAMGKPKQAQAVLKFTGNTWGTTFVAYSALIGLGWFVAQDLYPALRIVTPVAY